MNIQPDAGNRPAHRRNHHFGFFRRPGEGRSLQQQRDQHHEEGDVKEQAGVIKTGHHREDGENNWHRAAQANPADKHPLAQVKAAKRQQAGKDRQRAGDENHPHRQQQRRDGDRPQIRRREQQTEHEEHGDLRQPCQSVKVLQDPVAVANRPVAKQEAAQIHRQNTAAVQRRGDGKNHNSAAQRQQRIESRWEHDAVNHLQQQITAAETNRNTEAELLHDMHGKHPAQAGFVLLDHLNQGDGQEHRHRIVAAGFNLKRGANAFVKPFTAEQGKHRCRIG